MNLLLNQYQLSHRFIYKHKENYKLLSSLNFLIIYNLKHNMDFAFVINGINYLP